MLCGTGVSVLSKMAFSSRDSLSVVIMYYLFGPNCVICDVSAIKVKKYDTKIMFVSFFFFSFVFVRWSLFGFISNSII